MSASTSPSFDQYRVIVAITEAARAWRDPEYGPREEAVARTLEAPNRFTEEALVFAINQQMAQLTGEKLQAWLGGRMTKNPCVVGLLYAGNIPLAGLQDCLAVLLTGHMHLGSVSSKSPYLLPAFVDEIWRHTELDVAFGNAEEVFREADAVIATGTDETRVWVEEQCEEHGIGPERRLLRGHRYSVAVIDGSESEEEREGLAEDMLLHEGMGCRNVAVVWAPTGLDPDRYLEAMAAFRAVFPVHEETPGTLTMQQAMLDAVDHPHAYGEGLEFLLSRGEPEPQSPGHVRWVPYDSLDPVREWLEEECDSIQLVVAREGIASQITDTVPIISPGEAQRPRLDWQPDGQDTVEFLIQL